MSSWVRNHPKVLKLAKTMLRRQHPPKRPMVTIDAAVALAEEWSRTIPNQYDVVVGVPRAGLFLASVLSLKWGRPLSTPEDLLRGVVWESRTNPPVQVSDIRKVLVVEDTIYSGAKVEEVRRLLSGFDVDVATLFVQGKRSDLTDYAVKVKGSNWNDLLEWNLMKSYWGYGKPDVDMDGVLCEECPQDLDRDEPAYRMWMAGAKPYLLHPNGIGAIITAREERWKPQTEDWLVAHGVEYEALFMRFDGIGHFDHKAGFLESRRPGWYWESSPSLAEALHRRTGVTVLCTSTMELWT